MSSKYYNKLRSVWYQIFGFPKEIPITDEAMTVLTRHVNEWGNKLVEKAHEIAIEEGHPETITESNVIRAIKRL